MSVAEVIPSGHTQVKVDRRGRRSYYAYWEDAEGKHGKRLGPAHVKDSGRRTPRGAVIWRAGDGAKPDPFHLTPKDAAALLADVLAQAPRTRSDAPAAGVRTLERAAQAWMAARASERGLKRSTTQDYDDLFERLYRDLGADTPVRDLQPRALAAYFAAFEAQRVVGAAKAEELRKAGETVREVTVERWTAREPASVPIEVSTKQAAVEEAIRIGGTWKHRAPGLYRVTPPNAQRPRRVSSATARELEAKGWAIERRSQKRWLWCTPAAAQTRNKYRDLLAAVLDYARREEWIDANPLDDVRRSSRKGDRERILRRDDFYDPDEVAQLLERAPGVFEEAFWLCGFHAGLRLPGEALGLCWGAVDFQAGVLRVYDNWVRNEADTTKTSDSAPVPMTPRLAGVLAQLKQRGFRIADGDHVFTRDMLGRPAAERQLREAFKEAQAAAGLKVIPMYNARHSFGTSLARNGVDVRTIQALMRHDRLSTTEQYMAYAPRPELAERIAKALQPGGERARVDLKKSTVGLDLAEIDARLDEEIPAKWAGEVRRLLGMDATRDTRVSG
jgi:integrase